jgi:4-amino-4-deoxy-L-arabinose transferase-like glycosyltransferase
MNIDRTPNIETAPPVAAPRATARAWSITSPALIALLLGAAALLPRVLGLADFVTTDEAYHWIGRTERFADAVADRRWAATIQTGHPGVTLMWLGSLGLALERAAGPGWAGAPSLVAHLAWLRLPGAVLQALLVPAGYLLLRRLLTPTTALVAALLWATAPYLITHTRLLHLDALLTSFVTFSVLLLLLAIHPRTENHPEGTRPRTGRWRSVVSSRFSVLIGSGICAGLALLTKGPALILLPFAGLLLFALAPTDDRRPTTDDRRPTNDGGLWTRGWPQQGRPQRGHPTGGGGTQHTTRNTQHIPRFSILHSQFSILRRLQTAVPIYLLWLGVAAIVVVLLWPALWVDPARALRKYVEEIASNGGRPNGDGQFFLGRAVGDPGPLFYPIANLFRMTPVTLIGLLGLPLALRRPTTDDRRPTMDDGRRITHRGGSRFLVLGSTQGARSILLALLAFVLFWTLVMTLGPKKFDRYVLPTWPAIEVLAAAGLVSILDCRFWIVDVHAAQSKIKNLKSKIVLPLVIAALLLTDFWYHPYYLSYYNPLLGGGAGAQRALLIGWGEGMDQAGAWLRAQPDIGSGPVLSALGQTLQPFVPAPVRDVADLGAGPANYAVVYLESIQRAADPPLYDALRQTVPLHTVTIHGIAYAQIHQLPRPFEQAVGARWGAALGLHGVTIARAPGQIVVTPAWDVRAQPSADYQVFLHLIDAQGRRVGQIDVAPGGADFPPTSAWQPGRQVAVPLPLPLPADLPKGAYRLVMGLYDSASGQRPPLTEGRAADEALDGPSAVLLDTISLP